MRRVQEHGTHVNSDRYAKQLLIVQNLCRRLREDKYFENAEEGNVINKNLSAQYWKRMAEQDAEYLGKMFKFLQHWWD